MVKWWQSLRLEIGRIPLHWFLCSAKRHLRMKQQPKNGLKFLRIMSQVSSFGLSKADAEQYCCADFSRLDLEQLSQIPIVPMNGVHTEGKTAPNPLLCWLPPNQCFFAGDARPQFHSELFPFVDFGPRANHFLRSCGTKREPGIDDLVWILLDDPRRFYELANGKDL